MAEMAREVLQVNLEDEMRQSYLDYAMSVIVGRALPDVRDGLKPVHRRVLYAMHVLGNDFNKPYKKSARVVGDVIGKYHPHGDSAVYDTIVRLAQPFSMRYMMVDGQGNFGSIDGDSAAAMRYTEVRMAKIAHQMLADIDKETVNFIPNYDESEHEPTVLPARVPNLLVNGASGIAVGMATNIPPHNLGEVISALLAMIRDPDIGIDEIMEHLPGPDFPTAAIINGAAGIDEAYRTGRGRIYMRARTEIETDEDSGRVRIVVTELPYMVNKARLLEKIAELVKAKRVEGISELRDESDKDGMRMVIELKRGEVAEVVLNNLFQLTQLQSVFGINMVALVDGQPKLLDIQQMLSAFLAHRREVVTRRSLYELRKSRERAHILEGLTVAIANLDEVIALIKASKTPADAREALQGKRWDAGLVKSLLGQAGAELSRPEDLLPEYGLGEGGYQLSPQQAQAILDLRLQKLTGLEQDKLSEEYEGILDTIRELMRILSEPDALMEVIHDELVALRDQFDDVRRSEIVRDHLDLTMEDLITPEDVVVTLSHAGYAKYQPLDRYRAQKRGGRGRSAAKTKDEDFVERFWVTNTHDTLLVFTSAGKVYKTKVYELPQAGHNSRGRPMVNLLPLDEGERINAVLPTREFPDDWFVFFATRRGRVKKTPLSDFANIRSNGIWAVFLEQGDELVDVAFTEGTRDILLFSSAGKTVRFHESDARPMGRQTRGVLGIRLKDDQQVVSMLVADEGDVLLGTAHGYGKRTPLEEFPVHKRGGQGVIGIQTEGRNGQLVAALAVMEDDDVMLTSNAGTLVRTSAAEISRMSRNTQGVTLMRLAEEEQLIGMARVAASEDDGQDEPAADVEDAGD
ncbi:MAG: DNA gyrase subunit A [Gammaproteobacteria bacterium]|jgi:DNA gyrase subunit A|nr:DNA gyrase subunit A [Gammaproteobacteria bacterium]